MKKSILSFILSAAALCQMFTPVVQAEENYYSMIWGSDIHSKYTSFDKDFGFPYIAEIAQTDGENFKGVIINGDLADTGKVYEYAFLEDAIDKYLPNIPVFYSTGNHDVANYDSANCYEAMKVRFKKLEDTGYVIEREDKWSYDTYINGHHYIFLSMPYNDASGYALPDSQAAWLENKISESEKSGVPTFLFTHLPVAETTTGSYMSSSAPIKEIKEILQRHPSVIVGTGHVHLNLEQNTSTAVTDEYNTYIDLSSMSYTNVFNNPATASESIASNSYEKIYSRYVRVYDDRMVVQNLNMSTGEIIEGSDFTVDFAKNKFSATPSIVSDGSVYTVKLDGAEVDTELYNVAWYKDGATTDISELTYPMASGKNVCVKVSSKADGSYACASTDMAAYIEPAVPSTPSGGGGSGFGPVEITGEDSSKFYNNIVNVSGNVGAENAGKTLTVVLIPRNSYYDLSTAKYINDCEVLEDGSYSLKFKANADENDVLGVKLGNEDVTYSVTSAKTASEAVVAFDLSLNNEKKLEVDVNNIWLDKTVTKVIVAVYDAQDKLIKTVLADCALDFEKGSYVSEAITTGTRARAFVWESVETMLPLANDKSVDLPQAENVTE